MNWIQHIGVLIISLTLLPVSLPAGEISVDEIVKRANHVALYQGNSMKARVDLEIRDKQGRVRQRSLNILRMDVGPQDPDQDRAQKYMAYFRSPADVRKMVFMVHKHGTPDMDDDRWLYMPAMDLVKRIAAGDKRTSFAGSDFLYEDISGRAIFEDTHELVRSTPTHYILKNVPKDTGSVAFAYYTAHISKTNFITDKLAFYKKGDLLYRSMEVLAVRDIEVADSGVFPTVVRSLAKNLETGSETEMTLSRVAYDLELKAGVFSERYLRRPPREITR